MFIENYDDYGDFETMIISAVVAEQEQNGLNAGQISYFFLKRYFNFVNLFSGNVFFDIIRFVGFLVGNNIIFSNFRFYK